MEKYIGVKMVEAEPMTREAFNHTPYDEPDDPMDGTKETEGYAVTYPDGYKSWCPKAQFEAANFELEDGTKITKGDVARFMGPLTGEQISPKGTLVKALNSLTGFESYNVSSCVDPDNYSTELGVKYGGEPIKSEFWNGLGFVLQWAINGLKK